MIGSHRIKNRQTSQSLIEYCHMESKFLDPTKVNIKDHVTNNQKVKFSFYRDGQFWYKTELGFLFPISLEEVVESRVTLLSEDKALLFMRWMRKYVEACR